MADKKKHKLWSGVYSGSLNPQADDFNSSLRFDKKLYKEDILGSIAHCSMLGKQKIISVKDSELIIKTLKKILSDIEMKKIKITDGEDIHMFVEQVLTDRIGDVGKKLHTARSRNDQVSLDMHMFIKNRCNIFIKKIKELIIAIINVAKKHLDDIVPGFTHLQKAQPSTLAHYLLAYCQMFYRDLIRMENNLTSSDYMPLGSGALCGTTFNIDQNFVAKQLGFKNLIANSMDAISDRDYILEHLFSLATFMMHMSRINEEIIIWASNDYKYVTLPDEFSTGSSMMPQKRNPDISELIRGKTGRVYGDLFSLFVVMKGLPLSYNKDMQEDKEGLFDAIDTVDACIELFTKMFPKLKFNTNVMLEASEKGYMNATDVADFLVKKNIPFREAHEISGKIVRYCIEQNKTLNQLKIDEYKKFNSLFTNDIYKAINLKNIVEQRKSIGGPNKKQVLKQIDDLLKKVK
ncbi:MAG: argininosuccinate lyase [Mycoplasmataceae bacterium]|nr:argininosuccinate lyase [Mycoplasmataceae bacterium]